MGPKPAMTEPADDYENDGDGDDNMDSGNGAGGEAGTPDGHSDVVPSE